MLRQNWIACSLNIWLRPRLPLGWPCQAMFGSSQMSSEPRAFSASLYVFQFVVRYFWGAGFMRSGYQTSRLYASRGRFLQQSHIEMFYNPKRRHGFNEKLSPIDFEKRYFERLASV